MRKLICITILLIAVVIIAACGGSSSSNSIVTTYDTLATPIVSSASYKGFGGSVQNTSLALSPPITTVNTFGSVAGFSNISSVGMATFNRPLAVATDGVDLYVADYYNNAIRRVNIATKHVTTIAGNLAGFGGSVDAIGELAYFNRPSGIALAGGNLYVTDSLNYTIRKIDLSTRQVTTFAGGGGSNLSGAVDSTLPLNARFGVLNGITTDGTSLYVTDSNNTIRRIVISSGVVTTLAGAPNSAGSIDGAQADARFNQPARITTDGPNLYVTDFGNSTIRKIALSTGRVTTIAGKVGPGGAAGTHADSTDGSGQTARFNQPNGITCDGLNLYVTDSYDNRVRKIVLSGSTVYSGDVTTLATVGSAASSSIAGITTDGVSLFVTDISTDNSSHVIRELK
jgi:sugar lactone lactonase YvrE